MTKVAGASFVAWTGATVSPRGTPIPGANERRQARRQRA